MASIELPQESRHPSHSSIDLYSTSAKLNLRFVSDRKCAVDSRPPLESGGLAAKMTKQRRFGPCNYGCAGNVGRRCAAGSSPPPEGTLDRVKTESQLRSMVGPMKGQKFGNPKGKICRWTPELDEISKSAWARGGLRSARRAIRQQQPTWSWYSIKKRAAALELCRPKAWPWSETEVNHLLWSLDNNASLELISERLDRTVAAVRNKLRDLGYKAEGFGGYKVKGVADTFSVTPANIQYWIAEGLLTKVGAPPHRLPRLRHDATRCYNPAGGFLPRLEVIQRCGAPRWSVPRNKTFSNLGLSECLLPYRGPLRQLTRQRV